MTRPSKRTNILDAALRVAERDGVTGITLDAVAQEAGLTKAGLMYHFPSREALLWGIQEHLIVFWEGAMEAAAGKTAAEATPEERLAAYARVATESAGSAELALILEFSKHAGLAAQWDGVVARWTPTAEEAATDPRAFAMFIARLAADGLWSFESMYDTRLNPQFRSAVAEAIAAMIPATTSPDNDRFRCGCRRRRPEL